jgi:hypothetical protein
MARSTFYVVRATWQNAGNTTFNTQNEDWISIRITVGITIPAYFLYITYNTHNVQQKYTHKKERFIKNPIQNSGQGLATFNTFLNNDLVMQCMTP